MERLGEVLRGAAASVAAVVAMGALAVVALHWAGTPGGWGFVAAVLAAAAGGSVTVTGSLDGAQMPVAASLQGNVDLLPLGLTVVGALVFCLVFLRPRRTPWGLFGLRLAGALGAAVGALVAVLSAGAVRVPITLPATTAWIGRQATLELRPDATGTVVGALGALVLLAGACALLTWIPYGRVVAKAALISPAVLAGGGLILAAVATSTWAPLAGIAVLFGPNAMLGGLGSQPPLTLDGPLSTSLRPDIGIPTAVRLVPLLLIVLVGGLLLGTVRPGPGGRWQRAGTRALVSGGTVAVVLAVLSLAAGGSSALGVHVMTFSMQVLVLHVGSVVGTAVLAGALTGALAGFAGSLLADLREWLSATRTRPLIIVVNYPQEDGAPAISGRR